MFLRSLGSTLAQGGHHAEAHSEGFRASWCRRAAPASLRERIRGWLATPPQLSYGRLSALQKEGRRASVQARVAAHR